MMYVVMRVSEIGDRPVLVCNTQEGADACVQKMNASGMFKYYWEAVRVGQQYQKKGIDGYV